MRVHRKDDLMGGEGTRYWSIAEDNTIELAQEAIAEASLHRLASLLTEADHLLHGLFGLDTVLNEQQRTGIRQLHVHLPQLRMLAQRLVDEMEGER